MRVFPRKQKQSSPADERGQASVELVLVLTVLMILLFGAISLAQGVAVKHALDIATEKATRLLSIDPKSYDAAEALIRSEVEASWLGHGYGALVNIALFDALTGAPLTASDLGASAFGFQFRLETSVPFQADIPLLNLTGRTLTVSHWGIVERLIP